MSDKWHAMVAAALVAVLVVVLAGCSGAASQTPATSGGDSSGATGNAADDVAASTMTVEVNGRTFQADFADTEAAEQFRAMLPLTANASEFNGNEKYVQLDGSLPMDGASVVSPIEAGDIFLYNGNDVVLFYETHDNATWQYVPIARIEDAEGLADAVGSGDVTITYTLGQ